jgi:translation initiation factor 2A
VDTSGNSYYGNTGLFIVNLDGSVSRPVPQTKDGAVYCVQWSPNGSCFIVAAGKMPCHVSLFNPLGEPTYEFGALYRDVVSFSPHGRFLCLAGFGNLGGRSSGPSPLLGSCTGLGWAFR